jgi:hypothetical protein
LLGQGAKCDASLNFVKVHGVTRLGSFSLPQVTATKHHHQHMKRILISAVVGIMIGLVLGVMAGHKMQPNREQVVDFIGHQSLRELAEFNKDLLAQWGLQVYQPQMVRSAPTDPPK